MADLKETILNAVSEVKSIADTALPEVAADLADLVFKSMGTEPTDRGWSENSENTHKEVGVMGKFHRNVDTGFLAEYASIPGIILDDDWLDKMPFSSEYKAANALGKFDDIGRTPQDEEYIERGIEEALRKALS